MLSPVTQFGDWWAKREDLACFAGLEKSSGSKVRQYAAMVAAQPGLPLLVGCSANSAMQIYVAEAAVAAKVPGYVLVPKRKWRTMATLYAALVGATIIEVPHGYLSVVRARAKEKAEEIGPYVRWDPALAVQDAMEQCGNLPPGAERVLVATGSGLTCVGILAGMALAGDKRPVVAVAVSNMASVDEIRTQAFAKAGAELPPFSLIRAPGAYDKPKSAALPDGTPLDPYYAAKALPFVQPGDCFWIPGRRAQGACPP